MKKLGSFLLSSSLLAGMLQVNTARAQITWGPAQDILGDTDAVTVGRLVYAYDYANVAETVNGVAFVGVHTSSAGGNVTTTLSSFDTTDFTSTVDPFAALSTAYKAILVGAAYGTGTYTVTLNNLVSDHFYLVQYWANDPRGGGLQTRTVTLSSAGGNSVLLQYDYATASSGGYPGQYAAGYFKASGTSQTFTLVGTTGGAPYMNAIQVRDGTGLNFWGGLDNFWGGDQNGSWDYTATANWGTGQTFAVVSNLFAGVNFADTNALGGTVANNVITIQAAGESIGAVNFLNNAVNYTLENVAATPGITGPAAVNVLGSGTVTLTGPNTYTGATTLSNGTLALSGSGSISNSQDLNLEGGTFNVTAGGSFVLGASQPATFNGGLLQANGLTLNDASLSYSGSTLMPLAINATTLTLAAGPPSGLTVTALPGFNSYPAQYPLIKYGSIGGAGFNFSAVNLPPGYAGFLSNNVANKSIDLVLTSGRAPPRALTWTGVVPDGSTADWDVATTANWLYNGAAVQYGQGDSVVFTDSATQPAVNLTTQLSPGTLTITNTLLAYTFTGSGGLTGPATLVKSGTNLLVVNNSGPNTFAGGILAAGGTLLLQAQQDSIGGNLTATNGAQVIVDDNYSTPMTGSAYIYSGSLVQIGNNDYSGFLPEGSVTINAGGTLIFDSGLDIQVNNAISGAGTLIESNLYGVVDLANAANSSFSGPCLIDEGTVQIDGAQNAGTGTITISNGATFNVNIAGGTLTNTINGAGTINVIETSGDQTTMNDPTSGFTGTINCPGSPGGGAKVAITSTAFNISSAATIYVNEGGTFYLGAAVTVPVAINVGGTGNSEGYGALRPDAGAIVSGPVTLLDNTTIGEAGTGTGTISGPIGDNGMGFGITKEGSTTTTLTLAGINTYLGPTLINDGTLTIAATGSIDNSTNIALSAGTTFNVSAFNSWPLSTGHSLTGSGNITGALNCAAGSTVAPGDPNDTGTLTVSGAVTLGGATYMKLNGTANDELVSSGSITYGGTLIVTNFSGNALTLDTAYTLFTATNYLGSFASVQLPALSAGLFWLNNLNVNGKIEIVSSTARALTWSGVVLDGATADWDVATTANWLYVGAATLFNQGDAVTFDDTAHQPAVNLTTQLSPGTLTITNTLLAYTFTGSGGLTGGATLIKEGTNSLVVNNSGANTFTGGIVASGGTLLLEDLSDAIGGNLTAQNGAQVIVDDNYYPSLTGSTFIYSGSVVQIGNNDDYGILPAGSVTLNAGGALLFDGQNQQLVGNAISGGGALIQSNAAGTVELSISNPGFSGSTLIDEGTLQIDKPQSAGTGTITISNNGVLVVNIGANTLTNRITGSGTINFILTASHTTTVNGSMSGFTGTINCPVSPNSSSEVNLAGTTITSNTTVNVASAGEMYADGSGSVPARLYVSGTGDGDGYGAVRLNLAVTWSGPITLVGNTALGGGGIISGPIGDGGLGYSLTTGLGQGLTYDATNTYSGTTFIAQATIGSATTIAATGSFPNSTNIEIESGATLKVSAFSSWPLAPNQTLSGFGNLTGSLTSPAGSTVAPGENNATGTLTVSGAVTLQGTTSMKLNSPLKDQLASGGALTYGGTLIVTNISASPPAAGDTFTLFAATGYSGSFASIQLPALGPPLFWTNNLSVNGSISVVSSAPPPPTPPPLTWTGIVPDGAAADWDVQITANWLSNGASAYFSQGDGVTFSDAATQPNVNLKANLAPSALTVSNNLLAYTFTGAGGLTGTNSLFKQGTNSLAIQNTGPNNFTGGLVVGGGTLLWQGQDDAIGGNLTVTNGGKVILGDNPYTPITGSTVIGSNSLVQVGNNDYTGALPAGSITLNGGGALVFDSFLNPISVPNAISGAGALIQSNASATVDLASAKSAYTGPVTVYCGTLQLDGPLNGGTGTISLSNNGVLLVNIGANTLTNTITGAGAVNFILTSANTTTLGGVMSGFTGAINVPPTSTNLVAAKVAITSTPVALPTNATINVANGGTLYNTVAVAANINAAGAGNSENLGALRVDGGTLSGHVTLLGTTTIGENASGAGTISGPIGDGGLGYGIIKEGGTTSTLTLSGVNTYSGATLINDGTLVIASTGSIANSTNITVTAGTTLNVAQFSAWPLAAGQTLTGNGTVNGGLIVPAGATVAPGTPAATGLLTVTSNVTLSGAAFLKINNAAGGTNDVLVSQNGSLAYGGTLQVSNMTANAFTLGQSFNLFSAAGGYSGAFTTLSLPSLPTGLAWNTSGLATSGTISVAVPAPKFTVFGLSGTTLSLSGSGGTANGPYVILTSTNLAQGWTPVVTNSFDAGGNFNFDGTYSPSDHQRFYSIEQP